MTHWSQGSTALRRTAGGDAKAAYDEYVRAFKYIESHPEGRPGAQPIFDTAKELTVGEFTGAYKALAISRTNVAKSSLSASKADQLLDITQARLEGGLVFLNTKYATRPGITNPNDRNATTLGSYTAFNANYAMNATGSCLASTMVHETLHQIYYHNAQYRLRQDYGDPDTEAAYIQVELTGVGPAVC